MCEREREGGEREQEREGEREVACAVFIPYWGLFSRQRECHPLFHQLINSKILCESELAPVRFERGAENSML